MRASFNINYAWISVKNKNSSMLAIYDAHKFEPLTNLQDQTLFKIKEGYFFKDAFRAVVIVYFKKS